MIIAVFIVLSIVFLFLYMNKAPGSTARARYYNGIIRANDYTDLNLYHMSRGDKGKRMDEIDDAIFELKNDNIITRTEHGRKEKKAILEHLNKLKDRFYA